MLELFSELPARFGVRLHAYVLMNHHYHLVMETPEANLVAGMKWLQGTYTQRHNGRHKQFGHLFQGRYKAVAVDAQEGAYFQVVSTYIHLNPARAGLIRLGEEPLKTYRWSSYPLYLKGDRKSAPWLRREGVLGEMNEEISKQDDQRRRLAVHPDRVGNEIEQRHRHHEARRERDHVLERAHAPAVPRYDCGRSQKVRGRGDRGVKKCSAVHRH